MFTSDVCWAWVLVSLGTQVQLHVISRLPSIQTTFQTIFPFFMTMIYLIFFIYVRQSSHGRFSGNHFLILILETEREELYLFPLVTDSKFLLPNLKYFQFYIVFFSCSFALKDDLSLDCKLRFLEEKKIYFVICGERLFFTLNNLVTK